MGLPSATPLPFTLSWGKGGIVCSPSTKAIQPIPQPSPPHAPPPTTRVQPLWLSVCCAGPPQLSEGSHMNTLPPPLPATSTSPARLTAKRTHHMLADGSVKDCVLVVGAKRMQQGVRCNARSVSIPIWAGCAWITTAAPHPPHTKRNAATLLRRRWADTPTHTRSPWWLTRNNMKVPLVWRTGSLG